MNEKIASDNRDLLHKLASVANADLNAMSDEDAANLFFRVSDFAKAAADQGVDVHGSDPGAVLAAFNYWSKQASEKEEKEKDEEEKKAALSYAQKVAWAAEMESYYAHFGRVAADNYFEHLNELSKTASAGGAAGVGGWVKGASDAKTEAAGAFAKVKDAITGAGKKYMGAMRGEGVASKSEIAEAVGDLKSLKGQEGQGHYAKKLEDAIGASAKAKRNMYFARGGTAAAGAGVVGGGAVAAKKLYDRNEEKQASAQKQAFDFEAGKIALEILTQNNWDREEAIEKISGVLDKLAGLPDGVSDDVKVASTQSPEAACTAQAWEIIEAAGYPVQGLERS